MKKLILLPLLIIFCSGFGQNEIKVYPSSWWIGMKNPHLQLMIHGKNIGTASFKLEYPGVILENTLRLKNPNYLILDLTIRPDSKPGNIKIDFNGGQFILNFALDQPATGNGTSYARGIQSSDFIYLLMPDRFSNGDPNNDHYANMRDTVADRKDPLARHGGDLQGVINHLDYFQQLGVTALWLTPVIENDMPLKKEPSGWLSGYHGYWFTDHYEIDKRFGGKESYLKLVRAAHSRGLKIIQDAVYNHIGAAHWIMDDPPSEDWINQWPSYQGTNHREQAVFDIHGSEKDKEVMEAGWFVPHLPDLNLRNHLLATYLIQQAIWMTQEFQLDGWRVDTYKYCDPIFMNNLNAALEKEFPLITSFGEATVNTVAAGAYFCRNNLNVSWKSNLTGILDFPVCYAMLEAMKKKYGWTDGVNRLYTTLAEDMLYQNPMNNCIFLDNHDMDRFFSVIREDYATFQMGIGLLLTERGVPHLYYGTEILMKNFKNPSDAMVREDFPGGFPGDSSNKFLATGRTPAENAAFNFVSKLANFRKTSSALGHGALMQYIPSKGVYVYFRYDQNQTILCALNSDTVSANLNFKDYSERTNGFETSTDIMTGTTYPISDKMIIPARSITILELKKRSTANKVVH
ncbi:MAG TPA: alpha-amylase family glycosyl hydrolase [Puia sp.]